MSEVKHIKQIWSGCISGGCDHCDEGVQSNSSLMGSHDDYFANAVNHYVEKHGYRLLHVGQYTDHEVEGGLWHGVTAILGHDEILPVVERNLDLDKF